MTLSDESYSSGYDLVSKIYDKELGNVLVTKTSGSATIIDSKQSFTSWQTSPATGLATYMVVAKDGKGNEIYGWCGLAFGDGNDGVEIYDRRDLTSASKEWSGNTTLFDISSNVTYVVKKSNPDISEAFISAIPTPLKNGSDGSLITATGDLDTTVATQILADGYLGLLTNPLTNQVEDQITDNENIYFNMVFDAGYPTDVKDQISTLVQTRRDCVSILDNGDNSTFNMAITSRQNTNTFNNYYTALYEEYNKVYDPFTGQDIWVSPVYHMAYILPRNDNVAELWYAAAGFNRAAIDTIKESRFNPKLGQRDQMYLHQLNPIVKFSAGWVVWSQLTSQAKASAMQDLNIVRLILFIKRAFEQSCKFFIFEMNDQITWSGVSNMMVEFLEQIKKKRGLYSYTVEVSANDYEIKSKTFHANITLRPTRTTEKIELNFNIT